MPDFPPAAHYVIAVGGKKMARWWLSPVAGRVYRPGMLGALKDNLASRAAKSMLAGRIERYGQLTELRIRSKEKMLLVQVMLAGEADEIIIVVDRYRILPAEGGKIAIVIEAITASREWLQLLLEDFVVGQAIPIPAVAAMALGKPDSPVPVSSSTSERPS